MVSTTRNPAREVFSPLEVAFVTELSRRTIDQAIDRGEVKALGRAGGARARTLGFAEMVYLELRRQVGETLSSRAKRTLYSELRNAIGETGNATSVQIGPVTVSVKPALEKVRKRAALLRRIERFVSADPEVRAGEPVVRGTRVPVYVLADLSAQGASEEELLEDFPAVSREALHAALAYTRLHPRRGRPVRAPWRASE